MAVEVKVPEVGESITEGILVEWVAKDGEMVQAEAPLFELETDKVTMTVDAELSGRLSIQVQEGETVEVGQVVATLDPDATESGEQAPAGDGSEEKAEESDAGAAEEPADEEAETTPEEGDAAPEEGDAAPDDASQDEKDGPALSPAVRRLVEEHDLDPTGIEGTGKGGRILKEDVVRAVQQGRASSSAAGDDAARPASTAAQPEREGKRAAEVERFPRPRPASAGRPAAPRDEPSERQTREPMSRLRLRVAERLVEVQQTAAILTTFNEADMSGVMALRSRFKETFKERHGVGLGFMSFFVKAVVDALRTVPEVNGFIDGEDVVRNHFYDIGIAVSTDRGLVVPVLRQADRLSMADTERTIAELAERAQQRKLELAELQGAVFTISNGGVFGSMMSTPILNPPGSAILGMHAIEKRPVVVDDEIVVRPMMYLALSYDHRLIDGREAVTFLKRIKECIESPERMLLEV